MSRSAAFASAVTQALNAVNALLSRLTTAAAMQMWNTASEADKKAIADAGVSDMTNVQIDNTVKKVTMTAKLTTAALATCDTMPFKVAMLSWIMGNQEAISAAPVTKGECSKSSGSRRLAAEDATISMTAMSADEAANATVGTGQSCYESGETCQDSSKVKSSLNFCYETTCSDKVFNSVCCVAKQSCKFGFVESTATTTSSMKCAVGLKVKNTATCAALFCAPGESSTCCSASTTTPAPGGRASGAAVISTLVAVVLAFAQ